MRHIRFACMVLYVMLVPALVSCNRPEPAVQKPEKPMTGPRERLLARIGDINNPKTARPLVTLEEFFEGNDDPGSIGSNLPEPSEPRQFYELLLEIRKKPGVADVRIEVMQLEDPAGWPITDTIWIIASSSPEEVRSWFPEAMSPDVVYDGFTTAAGPLEAYSIPEGMRAVGMWYD